MTIENYTMNILYVDYDLYKWKTSWKKIYAKNTSVEKKWICFFKNLNDDT